MILPVLAVLIFPGHGEQNSGSEPKTWNLLALWDIPRLAQLLSQSLGVLLSIIPVGLRFLKESTSPLMSKALLRIYLYRYSPKG